MKASQYLYTCWKNAPNHGYCVYATSGDLSQEDAVVLQAAMGYKVDPDLPYEPTREEIERDFPRNVSYFRLPSGKYCLAQAVYIGHEFQYDEGDGGRMGNYLVHAFLIEDATGIAPLSFVGSDLFRRDLSREEWLTASPAPLPVVDIPEAAEPLPAATIRAFFDGEERRAHLAALIEAALSAAGGERVIYLNDTPQNMTVWFRALSMCLPSHVAEKLTFNTYSRRNVNADQHVPPASRLKIINIAPSGAAATAVAELARRGEYCFDFKNNRLSSAPAPGGYARLLVNTLCADPFAAMSLGRAICDLAAGSGLSADEAVDIYQLQHGNAAHFPTSADIERTLRRAQEAKVGGMADVCDRLAVAIIGGKFPEGGATLSLARALYPALPDARRTELLSFFGDRYLMHPAAGRSDADLDRYLSGFAAALPAKDAAYIELSLRDGSIDTVLKEALEADRIDAVDLYTAILAREYAAFSAAYGERALSRLFLAVAAAYARRQNYAGLDRLFARLRTLPGGEGPYVQALLDLSLSGEDAALGGVQNFFRLLEYAADDGTRVSRNLEKLIAAQENPAVLVAPYTDFCRRHPSLAGEIDAALRRSPACHAFVSDLFLRDFRDTARPTPDLLGRYFDSYYENEAEDGLFASRVHAWLRTLPADRAAADALAFYRRTYGARPALMDATVVSELLAVIFRAPARTIAETQARYSRTYFAFLSEVRRAGIRPPAAADAAEAWVILNAPGTPDTRAAIALLDTEDAAVCFAEAFLPEWIARTAEPYARAKDAPDPRRLSDLLAPFAALPCFGACLTRAIGDCRGGAQEALYLMLLAIAAPSDSPLAAAVYRVLQSEIARMKKGDLKRLQARAETLPPACRTPRLSALLGTEDAKAPARDATPPRTGEREMPHRATPMPTAREQREQRERGETPAARTPAKGETPARDNGRAPAATEKEGTPAAGQATETRKIGFGERILRKILGIEKKTDSDKKDK